MLRLRERNLTSSAPYFQKTFSLHLKDHETTGPRALRLLSSAFRFHQRVQFHQSASE
jgi:hypothetical protein